MDIHIIDDNLTVQEMLSTILRRDGYSVETYADAKAYLDLICSPGFTPPKVLITDLQMPEVDGYQLISGLRKINPEQKCIIITGFSADSSMQGPNCLYFCKPFRPQQLLDSISDLLA